MNLWGIILAAGSGSRFSKLPESAPHPCTSSGKRRPKQFINFQGAPLYFAGAQSMARVPRMSGLVFVFPPGQFSECEEELRQLLIRHDPGLPCLTAEGGARRQDSVNAGLRALPPECTHILVHDGARPFVTPELINRVCDRLEAGMQAVIPGVEVTDTIKQVETACGVERVTATPARADLRAVQTPQGFELASLRRAHLEAEKKCLSVTDDASLLESLGIEVEVVKGDMNNIKITHPEDMEKLERAPAPALPVPCNGFGYDVHKYGQGRPMKLGGVPIAGAPEVLAHSDGDVLLHALIDALLGCLAQGDIGELFPDTDAAYDNIDSGILLSEVMDRINDAGVTVSHVDLTIIAQIPKISPWKDCIAKNVASLMHLPRDAVAVKATTEEGLGFTGEKKGIKAVALVSAWKFPSPTPES
ncbi:MAG: 2-C-methyl-D-erythritol 4-phosphate cytidylyltransferase [Desulfovibrionaceae bacterium]|nr:2-C-methyl-D-erythritol 4-phosphate cytidylyltransferase [Desulfovibrionaceae bacterium]